MGLLHEQRNDLLWYLVGIEKRRKERRKKVGNNNSTAGRPRSDLFYANVFLFTIVS